MARVERQGVETFAQVVGGVIHDVNNLLFIALAAATKLRRHAPDDPAAQEWVEMIIDATLRAGALNRALLEGRGGSPEGPLTSVGDALSALNGLMQCILPPGVALEVTVGGEVGGAEVEPYELDRIVLNLVRNSLDAVQRGDRIEISATWLEVSAKNDLGLEPGRYVVVGVMDTGRGVDDAVADRIFAPFFTTKRDGNGLGLSSVDWLARRRGGAVRVTSRPRVAGTLFEVFLRAS